MKFRVSDLLERLQKVKEDGYSYCDIATIDHDEPGETSYLWVLALEEGGWGSVDYEDVEAASDKEVIRNAWTDYNKKTYSSTDIAKMQREMLDALRPVSEAE